MMAYRTANTNSRAVLLLLASKASCAERLKPLILRLALAFKSLFRRR
jgi:hypothetical protein